MHLLVVGILKSMRDTFIKNAEEAQANEDSSDAAFLQLIAEKSKAFDKMQESLTRRSSKGFKSH